jgi:hypothetical protein
MDANDKHDRAILRNPASTFSICAGTRTGTSTRTNPPPPTNPQVSDPFG